MNSTLFNQAADIFDRLLDLPEDQRTEQLRALNLSPQLEKVVKELLTSDSQAIGFMQEPISASFLGGSLNDTLPERIGRYAVVRLIGEGGMGAVYEAQQENPRRSVAVKVVRPGAASRETLSRFRREANVLGSMHHPNIAAIYEAGAADIPTPQGVARNVPFFAMELVRGDTLLDFIRHRNLPIPARLALFASICDAVDHAHRHGVIHRDLKPGNILVDEQARPKVLDFGVARAEGAESATLRTDALQVLGTIPYMSPEQISPGPNSLLDPRSDIYSLGVILYEMLTFRLPHDLRSRSIADAARVLHEEEPPAPSSFDQALRGDLDTIVAKALEKEPARRYQSAAQLAEDIRRHLRDEPITARPPTTIYELRKFARRNRTLVTSSILLFAVLSVALVLITSLYFDAQAANSRERERTREANDARKDLAAALKVSQDEVAKTAAINEFFIDDFIRAASPDRDGPEVKMLDLLTRAAERVPVRFKDQPLIQAEAHLSLADAFGTLDLRPQSLFHARKSLELFTAHAPPGSLRPLSAARQLVTRLEGNGDLKEALELAQNTVDSWANRIDPHDANYLCLQAALANLLQIQRRFDEAEAILKRVIPLLETHIGPNDPNTSAAINCLAVIYRLQDRINEALPLAEKLLTIAASSDNPFTLSAARGNYINVLLYLAQVDKAVAQADLLAAQVRAELPPNHQVRGYALLTAARVFASAGRIDDAALTAEEAYNVILLSRGAAEYNTEVAASVVRDFQTRRKDPEKMVIWIPRTFVHRLILAGDNEGQSLTKGFEEVFRRLSRISPTPDAYTTLAAGADEFVPLGHPRRARCYINLARATLTNGLLMHAWAALRRAEEALPFSEDETRDRALFMDVLRGVYQGSL